MPTAPLSLPAYLDQHASRIGQMLRELIACPTVNPPGREYDTMTQMLLQALTRAGCVVERRAVPASYPGDIDQATREAYPRWNVLGRWTVDPALPTIHFNAHYDVVPVSGTWKHGSPFSGTEDDGWIYGRGTADMKGSMASLLYALEALQATGTAPRANVEISFTADEETDSLLGTGWLVEQPDIRPDYVVVMEGGEGDSVCCGHNGVVWLEVVVHGKAAHGSTPEKGINALEHMSRLVLALETHREVIAQRTFTTPGGVIMRPTMNVGGVFEVGPGAKINTVPAEARFSIDRRVLAVEDLADVEKELREFLQARAAEIRGCRITINKTTENRSCFSPPDHPFFRQMATCVAGVRGKPTQFSVSAGFNDMHFFTHHLGVPTVGYGPGGLDYHAVDERARLSDLLDSAKIYARLLSEFAPSGP